MLRWVKGAQEGQGLLRRMLWGYSGRCSGCSRVAQKDAQGLLRACSGRCLGCSGDAQLMIRGCLGVAQGDLGKVRRCSGCPGDAQAMIRGCSGGCPEGCCSEDAQESQRMLRRCTENAQAMLRGFLGECSGDAHRLLRSSSFASPRSVGSAQPLARLLYKFLTRLIIVWRMFWQLHKRITRSLTPQPGSAAINPAVSLGAGFSHHSPLPESTGRLGELNQN